MSKKGKQEIKDLIEYCMKYYTCKLCPKNKECEEEEKKLTKKKR